MLTVKKLSEISGVSADTIRFYVRKGLLSPGRDAVNGYRFFSERDVRVLAFIQQAKLLGFSLNEIHGILKDSEKGRSPCAHVRSLMKHKIDV
ncbi:MAG: MerR family transcriptional regulator, partial [Gammaproteobacteria bacterium]